MFAACPKTACTPRANPFCAGGTVPNPQAEPLQDGLFELWFTCEGEARRNTYYFDLRRRVITLTTFRQQRQREQREVERARRAMRARGS